MLSVDFPSTSRWREPTRVTRHSLRSVSLTTASRQSVVSWPLTQCGEEAKVPDDTVDTWTMRLPELTAGFIPETCRHGRRALLPQRSMVVRGDDWESALIANARGDVPADYVSSEEEQEEEEEEEQVEHPPVLTNKEALGEQTKGRSRW